LSEVFPKKAIKAWVVLGLYILIYDIIAIVLNHSSESDSHKVTYETFSDRCWKAVDHPVARWPFWAAIVVIAKHLAAPNFLQKYDPIRIVGFIVNYIRKKLNRG
jgi:hypothetical protein